jgi:hypothetical protein
VPVEVADSVIWLHQLPANNQRKNNMTMYLCERCWGRSCLHLVAALRGGHWRWHLTGIRREIHFKKATPQFVVTFPKCSVG